jgi:hypothetical protein
MNYMMNMGGMYGYDMVYFALSNNVFTDDYYWENMALPHYQLLYVSYPQYNFSGGEFIIADTTDGDFVEYFYEIEDVDDQITVDEESFRINITDLTLSNDSGDSTYVLSGTLVPGTIDIEAGVPTAVSSPMFDEDFGPVSGDESMTWQLHENGTGLEIVSGEDYYDSWSDTTELQWSANDDSMTMVFLYWDDYYYEEDSDTMVFAYNVENDTLSINATMDLCEMMGDDYYYIDCYEMLSMVLGIEDIQEALMDFDMTMSYTGEIVDVPDLPIAPININDMVYWIYKSTWYTTDGSANGVQADFPKGTGGAIYADGIVWGGMVNDGNEQSPRVPFGKIRLDTICATIGCIPCALINPVDHVVDIDRCNGEIRHVNYLSCVTHGHIEIHQCFLNIFYSQNHTQHFITVNVIIIIAHHFTKVHCGVYAQGIVFHIIGKDHCV